MFRAPENLYHIGQQSVSTAPEPKITPANSNEPEEERAKMREACEADLRKLGLYTESPVSRG